MLVFADNDLPKFFSQAESLPGVEIRERREDRLVFGYRGRTFAVGDCDGADGTGLFVSDPTCPDDLQLEVANHLGSVAVIVEHYHQASRLNPLWCVLTVLALLALIALLSHWLNL